MEQVNWGCTLSGYLPAKTLKHWICVRVKEKRAHLKFGYWWELIVGKPTVLKDILLKKIIQTMMSKEFYEH